MKVDVMMTQTADDANSKFKSRPDESKTRQRQRDTKCRLAEQIEAEKVLLTTDINIETRLKNQGVWTRGQERRDGNNRKFTVNSSRQFGNKLDMGVTNNDELDWTNTSDDDTTPAAASSLEDFHTVRNLERKDSEHSTAEIARFLARPVVSCTPPSPTNDSALSPEKNPDASPSPPSPMETDSSSFFPASKITVERSIKDLSSKKLGLSPRRRLLYRYQMEEMMMHENNVEENIRPDGPAASGDLETSTDAGLNIEAGFAESPDSPYSWKTSRDVGTDSLEEPSIHNSVTELLRDCHICGYSPCSREDYDTHMKKTHFTQKCHLCIYWSRSPGRLSRHMKTFHSEPTDTPAVKKPKNPRKYNCKQCDFYTYVQEEIWNHTRVHVPASKLLSCPHCSFVCAFKHHMQYHMNNHLGYKPFKCPECNYRCNNKSMLNSHKKSHSNDYPYRCGVCNYAAKYRHALNIHLRKKRHFADGEVILEDSPRPGKARTQGGAASRNRQSSEHLPSTVHSFAEEVGCGMVWQQESQIGKMVNYNYVKQEPDCTTHSINASFLEATHPPAYLSLQPPLISISDLSDMHRLRYSPVMLPAKRTTSAGQNCDVAQMNGQVHPQGSTIPMMPASASFAPQNHSSFYEINQQFCHSPDGRQIPARNDYQAAYRDQEQEQLVISSPRSYSIDTVQDYVSDSGEEWPLDLTAKSNDKKAENKHRKSWDSSIVSPQLDWYECQHCGIIFPDRILYSMHMEYHCQSDPFQCNLCGQQTKDRREFFNHISQVAHN